MVASTVQCVSDGAGALWTQLYTWAGCKQTRRKLRLCSSMCWKMWLPGKPMYESQRTVHRVFSEPKNVSKGTTIPGKGIVCSNDNLCTVRRYTTC